MFNKQRFTNILLVIFVLTVLGRLNLIDPAEAAANSVTVNDQAIILSPSMAGGNMMAAVRPIAESLGAVVNWDSVKKMASIRLNQHTVELTPGAGHARVNGQARPLPVSAHIARGQFVAPLRFLVEALGGIVSWDGNKQVVAIQSGLDRKAPAEEGSRLLTAPNVSSGGKVGSYTGKLELFPAEATAGTTVTVTGTDFPPNEELTVVWNAVSGTWKLSGDSNEFFQGRDFKPQELEVATTLADGQGAFTAAFRVPEDFGFLHDISIVQDGVELNHTAFNLLPEVTISPSSGPVGTPVTVTVSGVGYQYLYNSWLLTYDNKFTGWLSSVTTRGKAVAVIPATGAPGTHLIGVMGGAFTFPYLNTEQSPVPKPVFALLFTITEGDPILPPPSREQGLPQIKGSEPHSAEPALWTDPERGKMGTPVVLHGKGFNPDEDVEFFWYRVSGNRVSGQGWKETGKLMGTTWPSLDGTVSFPFIVPDDLGGMHRIVAKANGQDLAETAITLSPSVISPSTAKGKVGTPITLHLKGGGWTETANIYTIVYDNAYLGYACAFNSQGDITINLMAAGEPGWHFIDLYPAIYKGNDAEGLQNFRIPQLTYAEDHPGEELPSFHYAFEIIP